MNAAHCLLGRKIIGAGRILRPIFRRKTGFLRQDMPAHPDAKARSVWVPSPRELCEQTRQQLRRQNSPMYRESPSKDPGS